MQKVNTAFVYFSNIRWINSPDCYNTITTERMYSCAVCTHIRIQTHLDEDISFQKVFGLYKSFLGH